MADSSHRLTYGMLGCVVIAFAPLMYYHLLGLWAEEYYQYFPFVLAAVGWFMWDRWQAAEPTTDSGFRGLLFWTMLVGGLTLLGFATLIWSAWLSAFAFVLVMGAMALQVYRQHGRITNQFGIWCLLWLLVPVPLQFDHRFVVRLQQISARLSGQVLDLLRIDHLMSGTVLQLPDKQFFVDEACSGIVSVMSVIAAGAIFVVWQNRTLFHALAVLVMGVIWAVVMNVGRITVIAVAHAWWEFDLSTGWQHDALGLLLFSFTFIALVSSDSLLSFLGEPVGRTVAEREAPHNALVRTWNRCATAFDPKQSLVPVAAGPLAPVTSGSSLSGSTHASLAIAKQRTKRKDVETKVTQEDDLGSEKNADSQAGLRGLSPRFMVAVSALCLALAGLQLFALSRGYRDPETPVELAKSIDTSLLPDQLGEWEKISFEPVERESGNEFGNYSKQFLYRHKTLNTTTTVSMDFPYRGGWHELSVCYRNFGWPLKERTVSSFPVGESAENWQVIQADYEKPDGQFGHLAFSGTNGTGDLLEPPSTLVLWRPWFRLRRRLLHRISPRFFQFQAWTTSNAEISQQTKDEVLTLFLGLRPYVRARLVAK